MKPLKTIAWRKRLRQQILLTKFQAWLGSKRFVIEQPAE